MTQPITATSVLVIEDTEAIGEMLSMLLTRDDRTVVHVTDGQAALDYLQQSSELPALILLDLQMPIMDGWTFRKIQCADAVWQHIPVVIMSAVADNSRLAQEMPNVTVLRKPLEPVELLDLVDHYTRHGRRSRRNG